MLAARGNTTRQSTQENVEVSPSTPPSLATPPNPTSRFTPKLDPDVKISADPTLHRTTPTDPTVSSPLRKTGGRNRKAKRPPKRPPISSKSPRTWNRPLAPGVLPAYDEALKVIKADSVRLKEEAKVLKRRIDEEVEAIKAISEMEEREGEELLEMMREKLETLEVQSEVNLPEVRWRVSNAMGMHILYFFSPSEHDC